MISPILWSIEVGEQKIGRGWKSGKIENILFSLIYVWLEEWKIGEMKNFFSLVDKKNGRIKNVICINLLSCFY